MTVFINFLTVEPHLLDNVSSPMLVLAVHWLGTRPKRK
jgi:hypothetical protein